MMLSSVAPDIPQLGAVVQVERGDRPRSFRGFHPLDDQLTRGVRQRCEDAAAVEPLADIRGLRETPGRVWAHVPSPGALVEVGAVPQPFGGLRWWWRCPSCDRRRATLYVLEAGWSLLWAQAANRPTHQRRWTCRTCLVLVYAVQQCDGVGRAQYHLEKLASRLGVTLLSGCPELPSKPPRMHWGTYNRIANEFTAVEAAMSD